MRWFHICDNIKHDKKTSIAVLWLWRHRNGRFALRTNKPSLHTVLSVFSDFYIICHLMKRLVTSLSLSGVVTV